MNSEPFVIFAPFVVKILSDFLTVRPGAFS
jgi:hypothetical protein